MSASILHLAGSLLCRMVASSATWSASPRGFVPSDNEASLTLNGSQELVPVELLSSFRVPPRKDRPNVSCNHLRSGKLFPWQDTHLLTAFYSRIEILICDARFHECVYPEGLPVPRASCLFPQIRGVKPPPCGRRIARSHDLSVPCRPCSLNEMD